MAGRDKRYEWVYNRARDLANEALREFKSDPEAAMFVPGAQAEAFVRTLRGYTLRHLPKSRHAHYLHGFFTAIMRELLEGNDHIEGHIVFRDRPKKKK